MKSFARRGQAFIVFENVQAATIALQKLQGSPYEDKPMVRCTLGAQLLVRSLWPSLLPQVHVPRASRNTPISALLSPWSEAGQRRTYYALNASGWRSLSELIMPGANRTLSRRRTARTLRGQSDRCRRGILRKEVVGLGYC